MKKYSPPPTVKFCFCLFKGISEHRLGMLLVPLTLSLVMGSLIN